MWHPVGVGPETTLPVKSRLREWSRAALAMAALFGSLPIASRVFLGGWGFEGAAEIACLCLIAGAYLHLAARKRARVADAAALLGRGLQLASVGQLDRAMSLFNDVVRVNPYVWQGRQYRGELYLHLGDARAALADFSEAIRLAPGEPHLLALRDRAQAMLGEDSPAGSMR